MCAIEIPLQKATDVTSWIHGACRGLPRVTLSRLGRALSAVAEGAVLRRAERRLETLPDNLLKDMGTSRSEIWRRVRGRE